MKALVAALLGVVALTGCLDVCTRAELMNAQFQKRHAACFPDGMLVNARFDGARCDASMKVCTATDEQTLQRYFDCLDRLPVCSPEKKSDFNDAVLACASDMTALSPGCFAP